MKSWEQVWDQLDKEPNGAVVVVAGPHNGDATWATPHFPLFKQINQRLIVVCPSSVIDIFHHNPHIDRILITDRSGINLAQIATKAAESKKFSFVLPPISIWPVNNQFNLLRTKQYLEQRGYQITNITPDLYISNTETNNIIKFVEQYQGGPKILAETFNYSQQSAFNSDWLIKIVDYLAQRHPNAWVFVPCSQKELPKVPTHPMIVPIYQFTVRESGYFSNFCDYFLSCSSGISHACSSTLASQNLRWLETVTKEWHCTKPYGIKGRKYHIGKDFDGYFRLLQELLA